MQLSKEEVDDINAPTYMQVFQENFNDTDNIKRIKEASLLNLHYFRVLPVR